MTRGLAGAGEVKDLEEHGDRGAPAAEDEQVARVELRLVWSYKVVGGHVGGLCVNACRFV